MITYAAKNNMRISDMNDMEYRNYKRARAKAIAFKKNAVKAFLIFALIIIVSVIFKSFNTKAGSVSDAGQCKYYKTVNLGFEETVRDVAEANFDADNYSSIEAYIDEIYEVNHIEEDDTFAGGKLLYIPYYGEIH